MFSSLSRSGALSPVTWRYSFLKFECLFSSLTPSEHELESRFRGLRFFLALEKLGIPRKLADLSRTEKELEPFSDPDVVAGAIVARDWVGPLTIRAFGTPVTRFFGGSTNRPDRSDPSEGDYYLKPRLSRGFFMSAIHRLRKHLVRMVLKDHHSSTRIAKPAMLRVARPC
jgi:hypothetical protein